MYILLSTQSAMERSLKFRIDKLGKGNLAEIINVEKKAFIPPIQASKETIVGRLEKGHTYLGVYEGDHLVGTSAFRYVQFNPDLEEFVRRYPSFEEYANSPNDKDVNGMVIYNLGVIPEYRGGRNASLLLSHAFSIAKDKGLDYVIGDGRIPSYNGGYDYPSHERFERNPLIRETIDRSLKEGTLPDREILKKDPITGFYLLAIPNVKILGVTDEKFCAEDRPTGGRKVIVYVDLTEEK